MDSLEKMRQHAMNCSADVALWPQWKRNSPPPTPDEVSHKDILCAAIRRIGELTARLQERERAYPFPELTALLEDLHQVQVRAEEDYLPNCGKSPLEQLADAADNDD